MKNYVKSIILFATDLLFLYISYFITLTLLVTLDIGGNNNMSAIVFYLMGIKIVIYAAFLMHKVPPVNVFLQITAISVANLMTVAASYFLFARDISLSFFSIVFALDLIFALGSRLLIGLIKNEEPVEYYDQNGNVVQDVSQEALDSLDKDEPSISETMRINATNTDLSAGKLPEEEDEDAAFERMLREQTMHELQIQNQKEDSLPGMQIIHSQSEETLTDAQPLLQQDDFDLKTEQESVIDTTQNQPSFYDETAILGRDVSLEEAMEAQQAFAMPQEQEDVSESSDDMIQDEQGFAMPQEQESISESSDDMIQDEQAFAQMQSDQELMQDETVFEETAEPQNETFLDTQDDQSDAQPLFEEAQDAAYTEEPQEFFPQPQELNQEEDGYPANEAMQETQGPFTDASAQENAGQSDILQHEQTQNLSEETKQAQPAANVFETSSAKADLAASMVGMGAAAAAAINAVNANMAAQTAGADAVSFLQTPKTQTPEAKFESAIQVPQETGFPDAQQMRTAKGIYMSTPPQAVQHTQSVAADAVQKAAAAGLGLGVVSGISSLAQTTPQFYQATTPNSLPLYTSAAQHNEGTSIDLNMNSNANTTTVDTQTQPAKNTEQTEENRIKESVSTEQDAAEQNTNAVIDAQDYFYDDDDDDYIQDYIEQYGKYMASQYNKKLDRLEKELKEKENRLSNLEKERIENERLSLKQERERLEKERQELEQKRSQQEQTQYAAHVGAGFDISSQYNNSNLLRQMQKKEIMDKMLEDVKVLYATLNSRAKTLEDQEYRMILKRVELEEKSKLLDAYPYLKEPKEDISIDYEGVKKKKKRKRAPLQTPALDAARAGISPAQMQISSQDIFQKEEEQQSDYEKALQTLLGALGIKNIEDAAKAAKQAQAQSHTADEQSEKKEDAAKDSVRHEAIIMPPILPKRKRRRKAAADVQQTSGQGEQTPGSLHQSSPNTTPGNTAQHTTEPAKTAQSTQQAEKPACVANVTQKQSAVFPQTQTPSVQQNAAMMTPQPPLNVLPQARYTPQAYTPIPQTIYTANSMMAATNGYATHPMQNVPSSMPSYYTAAPQVSPNPSGQAKVDFYAKPNAQGKPWQSMIPRNTTGAEHIQKAPFIYAQPQMQKTTVLPTQNAQAAPLYQPQHYGLQTQAGTTQGTTQTAETFAWNQQTAAAPAADMYQSNGQNQAHSANAYPYTHDQTDATSKTIPENGYSAQQILPKNTPEPQVNDADIVLQAQNAAQGTVAHENPAQNVQTAMLQNTQHDLLYTQNETRSKENDTVKASDLNADITHFSPVQERETLLQNAYAASPTSTKRQDDALSSDMAIADNVNDYAVQTDVASVQDGADAYADTIIEQKQDFTQSSYTQEQEALQSKQSDAYIDATSQPTEGWTTDATSFVSTTEDQNINVLDKNIVPAADSMPNDDAAQANAAPVQDEPDTYADATIEQPQQEGLAQSDYAQEQEVLSDAYADIASQPTQDWTADAETDKVQQQAYAPEGMQEEWAEQAENFADLQQSEEIDANAQQAAQTWETQQEDIPFAYDEENMQAGQTEDAMQMAQTEEDVYAQPTKHWEQDGDEAFNETWENATGQDDSVWNSSDAESAQDTDEPNNEMGKTAMDFLSTTQLNLSAEDMEDITRAIDNL